MPENIARHGIAVQHFEVVNGVHGSGDCRKYPCLICRIDGGQTPVA